MGNRNSLLEKLGRLYAHCSLVVANSNTSHDGIAKKIFFFYSERNCRKDDQILRQCFRM